MARTQSFDFFLLDPVSKIIQIWSNASKPSIYKESWMRWLFWYQGTKWLVFLRQQTHIYYNILFHF